MPSGARNFVEKSDYRGMKTPDKGEQNGERRFGRNTKTY